MTTPTDEDSRGPGQEPLEYGALASRFEVIHGEAARTPDSLVPRSIMRGIAAGLSRAPSLRRTDPLKSHQQRSLWARLADAAPARPDHCISDRQTARQQAEGGEVLPEEGLRGSQRAMQQAEGDE